MEVVEIHARWASDYKLQNFKKNFATLCKQLAAKKKKEEEEQNEKVKGNGEAEGGEEATIKPVAEAWKSKKKKKSPGYELLFRLYMDRNSGIHVMTVEEIWDSSPWFRCYDLNEFKKYNKEMISLVKKYRGRIEKESADFLADQSNFPRKSSTHTSEPFWDTHPARKLLEADVMSGLAYKLKPNQLYKTQPAYSQFTIDTFRCHIYQEKYAQKAVAYWQCKRNIIAQRQHSKEMDQRKYAWEEKQHQEEVEALAAEWAGASDLGR